MCIRDRLQTLVCKAASEVWSDDDRLNFSALYTMFSQQFYALGGSALELTPGDALLVYLSVYRYSDACQSTPSQVRENPVSYTHLCAKMRPT